MDKKQLKYDIGTVALLCGLIGEHMKVEPDTIVSDEEKMVVNEYAKLANAIYKLTVAIDALPAEES